MRLLKLNMIIAFHARFDSIVFNYLYTFNIKISSHLFGKHLNRVKIFINSILYINKDFIKIRHVLFL
jgi:hypothetical protein